MYCPTGGDCTWLGHAALHGCVQQICLRAAPKLPVRHLTSSSFQHASFGSKGSFRQRRSGNDSQEQQGCISADSRQEGFCIQSPGTSGGPAMPRGCLFATSLTQFMGHLSPACPCRSASWQRSGSGRLQAGTRRGPAWQPWCRPATAAVQKPIPTSTSGWPFRPWCWCSAARPPSSCCPSCLLCSPWCVALGPALQSACFHLLPARLPAFLVLPVCCTQQATSVTGHNAMHQAARWGQHLWPLKCQQPNSSPPSDSQQLVSDQMACTKVR